jgi:hypothetical protein
LKKKLGVIGGGLGGTQGHALQIGGIIVGARRLSRRANIFAISNLPSL